MAHKYEELKYSRSQVKNAGKTIIKSNVSKAELENAQYVINNWRASHSFPMQTIYMHLRNTAPNNAIVAQRLKRTYSITQKLYRFPKMSLTTMQDIGGCRMIVDRIDDIYNMIDRLKKSRMRHKLKEVYDYIKNPKDDGYRSYHIVYSYYSDRSPKYNGLFVEIQIRTHLQHLWATAVETMDTFTGDPLKIGKGDPNNKEFFRLVSKLLEIYEMNNCDVSAVKQSDVLKDFIEYENEYHILQRMQSIRACAEFVSHSVRTNEEYYILKLNRKRKELWISTYSKNEIESATEEYDRAEKERTEDEDIVLVSTSSANMLKQAYPNYFTDITEFVNVIKSFLQ